MSNPSKAKILWAAADGETTLHLSEVLCKSSAIFSLLECKQDAMKVTLKQVEDSEKVVANLLLRCTACEHVADAEIVSLNNARIVCDTEEDA